MTHGARLSVHFGKQLMHALMRAMSGCSVLCSVWSCSSLSLLNGNLNIEFWFLLEKHKLHLKRINSPNSSYGEPIPTACIIHCVNVDNECAQAGGLLFGEGEMLHNDQQNRMWEPGRGGRWFISGLTVSRWCRLSQESNWFWAAKDVYSPGRRQ